MGVIDSNMSYSAPQIEVVVLNAQGVLCGSLDGTPGINEYGQGSDSHYGFGDED